MKKLIGISSLLLALATVTHQADDNDWVMPQEDYNEDYQNCPQDAQAVQAPLPSGSLNGVYNGNDNSGSNNGNTNGNANDGSGNGSGNGNLNGGDANGNYDGNLNTGNLNGILNGNGNDGTYNGNLSGNLNNGDGNGMVNGNNNQGSGNGNQNGNFNDGSLNGGYNGNGNTGDLNGNQNGNNNYGSLSGNLNGNGNQDVGNGNINGDLFFGDSPIHLSLGLQNAQPSAQTSNQGNLQGNQLLTTNQGGNSGDRGNNNGNIIIQGDAPASSGPSQFAAKASGDAYANGKTKITLRANQDQNGDGIKGDQFLELSASGFGITGASGQTSGFGDFGMGNGNGNLNGNSLINIDYFDYQGDKDNAQTQAHMSSSSPAANIIAQLFSTISSLFGN